MADRIELKNFIVDDTDFYSAKSFSNYCVKQLDDHTCVHAQLW